VLHRNIIKKYFKSVHLVFIKKKYAAFGYEFCIE
jgi:hypothetical protein